LTTAQLHQLVADIIDEEKCLSDILATVDYHQHRNYAAYLSHRKRTLKRHRGNDSPAKKRKVS
jgi:hypothetical protein